MIVKKRVEKDGCKNSMMASKIQFPINSEPFVNTYRDWALAETIVDSQ